MRSLALTLSRLSAAERGGRKHGLRAQVDPRSGLAERGEQRWQHDGENGVGCAQREPARGLLRVEAFRVRQHAANALQDVGDRRRELLGTLGRHDALRMFEEERVVQETSQAREPARRRVAAYRS